MMHESVILSDNMASVQKIRKREGTEGRGGIEGGWRRPNQLRKFFVSAIQLRANCWDVEVCQKLTACQWIGNFRNKANLMKSIVHKITTELSRRFIALLCIVKIDVSRWFISSYSRSYSTRAKRGEWGARGSNAQRIKTVI